MTNRTRLFSLVLLLFLTSLACDSSTPPLPRDETPTVENPPAANWYSVYFTDPTGPSAEYYEGGPDEALAAAIDQARLSVDVAVYDLNLATIRDALLHAAQRGVAVRVVLESDNMDDEAVQALKDADIPILGDRREGLMHNKFVVIDRLEVWGGSMNFTSNDAYRNNNNLIRLRSTKIAENYTTEFNEMFDEDLFGPDDRAQTPYPNVTISGTPVEIYFSPDDGVAQHLLDLVDSAQQNICFLAFSFTSDELADALLAAHKDGVQIAGVFEESQVNSNGTSGEYDTLRSAGLDVWIDANPRNMHNKVFVVDGQVVWTGSYNFSASAEKKNDENAMVIHNPEIAALYQAECEKLVALAKK
jgi:phosphatidylserine/phosphatidylglycerophosphate/cardiolipin synthase-like enzyme